MVSPNSTARFPTSSYHDDDHQWLDGGSAYEQEHEAWVAAASSSVHHDFRYQDHQEHQYEYQDDYRQHRYHYRHEFQCRSPQSSRSTSTSSTTSRSGAQRPSTSNSPSPSQASPGAYEDDRDSEPSGDKAKDIMTKDELRKHKNRQSAMRSRRRSRDKLEHLEELLIQLQHKNRRLHETLRILVHKRKNGWPPIASELAAYRRGGAMNTIAFKAIRRTAVSASRRASASTSSINTASTTAPPRRVNTGTSSSTRPLPLQSRWHRWGSDSGGQPPYAPLSPRYGKHLD